MVGDAEFGLLSASARIDTVLLTLARRWRVGLRLVCNDNEVVENLLGMYVVYTCVGLLHNAFLRACSVRSHLNLKRRGNASRKALATRFPL
jgi:hypothetical protein